MDALLEIEDLKKYYGKEPNQTKALNGITFQVMPGEFLGIMGSSGSGKSTLLNCIATVIQPDSGKIRMKGTEIQRTIVVDADGLNLLSAHKDLLTAGEISRQTGNISLVITPHIKEMSRLTGKTVAELKEAPVRECRTFAEAETLVCVLKDARTCVSAGGVHTYMNTSGNDGMATAGSGDVLAGMIAGLSAGGISPAEAARLGVYIHGLAGDRAKKRYGKAAMTAGSLIDEIGPVMSSYV